MKFLLALIFFATLLACGSKNDDESVGAKAPSIDNDFTNQFSVLKLRFSISDTSLDKNISTEKPLKVFGKTYFPDDLIYNYFEKGSKINYYPVGKVQNGEEEIYVVIKAISGTRKAAFVLVYDNQLKYKDGSMICQTDGDNKTTYFSSIDRYFNITIRRTDFILGQEPSLTEIFLAYNNVGKLGQVVTNDSDGEVAFVNPIDTLPQTQKFTGDYFLDKDNIISIRNGKDSGTRMLFFTYEKDKETCIGEIKDVVRMIAPNKAIYQKDGDPCNIEFTFTGTTIVVKEGTDCGNKKGTFDCTLNGVFVKQVKKDKASATNTKEIINPLGAKPAAEAAKPTTDPKLGTTKPGNIKPGTKPAAKATTGETTIDPVTDKPNETAPKTTEPKKDSKPKAPAAKPVLKQKDINK
jgi:hypothetical protein